MRNFLYGLVVLCLTLTASCSKDDNFTDDNLNNAVSNRNIENSGVWIVTLFSEDGKNQTNAFADFAFDFKSNGLLIATKSIERINGTWKYVTDSGKLKILIGFPNTGKFDDLTEDWELIQETETIIRLKHVSGGNGRTDILEFGRPPGEGSNNSGTTTSPVTANGSWKVIRYLDKDKNRTSYYSGFGFEFKSGGVITASKGTVAIQGSWKIVTDSGKSKMIFSFPIQNKFDELNDDWEIILQSHTTILLKNVSGGNGGICYLDFGK